MPRQPSFKDNINVSTRSVSARISAALALLALAITGAWADDGTCANPVSRPSGRGTTQESLKDNPAARAGWFLNGRRPSGPGLAGGGAPESAARKLLRSFQQFNQMPRRGLAAAPASWVPLGPTPQVSLYWGNVSGRVTSLAVDGRDQQHVLYVGTAFGGLWKTEDFTSPSPHFLPLGDTNWPSLAVGSIALDTGRSAGQPPIIYVGTGEANESLDSYYGVGILKSSDGGNSWSLTTGTGGLVALSSSAQYALDGPFVGAAVSKILVDPADPNHIMVSVSSSFLGEGRSPKTAIYESPNAGDSWHPMTVAGKAVYNTVDLVYEPVQAAFYAAVQGLGLYRLGAGESQWKATASPFGSTPVDGTNFDRASLATRAGSGKGNIYAVVSAGYFAKNDPRNYYLSKPNASATGIVQSSDGGSTWTPVSAPTELFGDGQGDGQGFYDQWIAAPSQGDSILVGGIDIWRSATLSGLSWTNLSRAYEWADGRLHPNLHIHPDQHAVVVLDDAHWIVGNDGGVWRTEDGGTSWIDLNTDISSIQLMSVTSLRAPANGYLGGSQDNGTALVGAIGQPWTTTLTGDGGFTQGNPTQPLEYFTERFNVSLCRSDDSGQQWKTVVDSNAITDDAPFYVPYQLLRPDHDEIALGTRRVWLGDAVPTSAGAGWRPVSGPLTSNGFIQAIAVAPSSPKTLYVATSDGMIYLNTDVEAQNASLKWSAIKRSNLPQNRPYAAIAIDPKNAKVAYLAVQGFGVGHVFRTDSGGKSWHDVTPSLVVDGRPTQIDTPVNSVLVDPLFPSNVYVATDIGVFVSSDRGTTWQPHGAALPRTAVLELKISIDRKIIAATHGRGAWAIEPLSH
jgi:hypothetical protein